MNAPKLLEFPVQIMVIDNFLKPKRAEEVLEECIALKPFYQDATIFNKEQAKDMADSKFRQNDVVYIDQMFQTNRRGSKILHNLVPEMATPEEQKAAAIGDSVFSDEKMAEWAKGSTLAKIIQMCSHNETILSRYGNCDFYGWHTDSIVPNFKHPQRIMTIVYYVNKRPERFTGGTITFKHGEGKDEKTISVKPKHNRAVVFPCSLLHSVENVRLKSDKFEDGRFSLNLWFGFNS